MRAEDGINAEDVTKAEDSIKKEWYQNSLKDCLNYNL